MPCLLLRPGESGERRISARRRSSAAEIHRKKDGQRNLPVVPPPASNYKKVLSRPKVLGQGRNKESDAILFAKERGMLGNSENGGRGESGCSDLCRLYGETAEEEEDDGVEQQEAKMAANIPYEICKYNKNVRYLKKLVKDTQQTLEEIRNSGSFYKEYLACAQTSPEDLEQINASLDREPCIIVHGQNCYAKTCVVNELFGKKILPIVNTDGQHSWRMVRFTYGQSNQISLALPDSYELVEHLQALEQPWRTVPRVDLELSDEARKDPARESAHLEIRLKHPLLKDNVDVVMTPHDPQCSFASVFASCLKCVLPIVVYAISEDCLSDKDKEDLKTMKSLMPDIPVAFIRVRNIPTTDLTESEQHARCERQRQFRQQLQQHQYLRSPLARRRRLHTISEGSLDLFQQLCDLGFLNLVPSDSRRSRHRSGPITVESELIENFDSFPSILLFVRHILQSSIVNGADILHRAHNSCLKMFINAAFDMARDLLVTPKRLEYVRRMESKLYDTLLEIANEKQEEIKDLIVETITGTKDELIEKAACYEFRNVLVPRDGRISSARELRICTGEIQDLVLGSLNSAVATKLIGSVECLRESVVGTLQRCLENLETVFHDGCDSPQASSALKQQILTAAYQVEVTVKTSSSVMRVLWEKMKQLIQSMPGKTPPHIDSEWKRKVASDMIGSLSEWRLAKSICSQFRDRLKIAHEAFASSLRQLEAYHSGRLEKTEEQRLKVRKVHAPKIARYALESTSLRDVVLFGMPQLGREVGRGQYGVVYSCDSWGGFSPCALKSVVPPDEKHWNDLALEFHYTRSVPEHERLVTLHGSVIDHSYASGSTPAVLLIMERMQRDLYSAIRAGLDWLVRLQIALDVIQGIRFLHSQGLVHRDIKLKNVLLDKRNRAKLTDLGFCKPEAMMSGSIVGTPIHMAPELFCGKYDHRVDVYAFGILFWYICAGHVRLPYVYEQCQNKDQLWSDVKRGVRPERLPQFDNQCWSIMEECWAGDPLMRPLLGEVELRLLSIISYYKMHPAPSFDFQQREIGLLSSSPYIDIDFDY